MTAQPITTTPTPVTWPSHDPATYRVVPEGAAPLDAARVASLLANEWERFRGQTPRSGEHHARALGSLPLGVPSSFQHWDPYPIAVTSAKGAWLTDVDGRQVLDLSMGFGAMLVGHLNPTVVAAVAKAL
ncbi:MAG: aminotransferase class III-fold pyridoxal phosphate-dependent enzyme, partial [Actinomycetes bacterium]